MDNFKKASKDPSPFTRLRERFLIARCLGLTSLYVASFICRLFILDVSGFVSVSVMSFISFAPAKLSTSNLPVVWSSVSKFASLRVLSILSCSRREPGLGGTCAVSSK